MPNLEWDVPHEILSPLGNVELNTIYSGTGSGGGPVTSTPCCYRVLPDSYKIVPTMRVTQDNVSQQDGSVLHPRYISGQTATIKLEYSLVPDGVGPDALPACGADLRLMHEYLMVNIQALLRPVAGVDPNTNQRLIWTPTGAGDTRILQAVQTLGWPQPSYNGLWAQVEFELESPYPYAINGTPDPLSVTGAVIPNDGDAPFWPVFHVASGVTTFTISNIDTGETIFYNGASIGGTFAEIVTFDGTIFQDGSGADLVDGLVPTETDFFPIQPGGTTVGITGSTATVEAHDAYC